MKCWMYKARLQHLEWQQLPNRAESGIMVSGLGLYI